MNQKEGKYPYAQLPVITLGTDDKTQVSMSGAMSRYAAKLTGLYPSDPLKALFVDEAYEAVASALDNSVMFSLTPEQIAEKKKIWLERDLIRLDNLVKLRLTPKSPFIANQEFSMADIAFYTFFSTRRFASPLNYFTVEEIQTGAPALWSYIQNLTRTPEIQKCDVKSDEFHDKIGREIPVE